MLPKPKLNPLSDLSDHVKFLQLQRRGIALPRPFDKLSSENSNPPSSFMFQPAYIQSNSTGPFQCYSCSSVFKSRQGLNRHIGKVHLKSAKTEKCPQCEKFFMHKYAVKFHIAQVHEKATRSICEFCGQEMYNKYEMEKHVRRNHPRSEEIIATP